MLDTLALRPGCTFVGEPGIKACRELDQMVRLTHLRKLSLHCFHCNGQDLATFLQKHRTLRELDLKNVNILGS